MLNKPEWLNIGSKRLILVHVQRKINSNMRQSGETGRCLIEKIRKSKVHKAKSWQTNFSNPQSESRVISWNRQNFKIKTITNI